MNGRALRFLVVAILGAASAFGTTVNINTGSNPFPNGIQAPFQLLVNGKLTTLECDDFFDSITANETWTATVLTLAQLNASNYTTTRFGASAGSLSAATTLYEKVAYLALQFASNPIADWAAIQTALWQVFDPGVASVGTTGPTSSNYWASLANTNYASVAALAASIQILTPVAGSQTPGHGLPQEFITTTPEPATYAMFGIGLILLSLVTFRRSRKASK